ncbi:CNP1-like family protein [uncultured Lamprocystis sp.]|jgi:hypothetical protein|uniref:CNP1-like family protein n=1 Tax=uncultured Lamprocystis sp. TaxID=543132 RepID=UPI0025D3A2FE|nr:CNP1-like family protein [uncultured Lamprocystis sp.]
MPLRRYAPLILMPLLLGAARTNADNNFKLDPEPIRPSNVQEGAERQEAAVNLPPWPRDQDLLAFTPEGPRSPFKFFIDGKNLRIDEPIAAVRYTLVIELPSGGRNVSYEGIRCTLKGAWKTYAYGSDGAFAEAPAAEWQPLSTSASEAYRDDLRRHYLCVPRETRTRPLKDILRALQGRGRSSESTGFQAN